MLADVTRFLVVHFHYNWVTLAGLAADIIGFSILAWDILPEYRIYRMRALNALLHNPNTDLLSQLSNYRTRPDDPLVTLATEMKYISSMQSLRRRVGLAPMNPREPLVWDGPISVLTDLIERWEREVAEGIDRVELDLHKRWRPPLRLGIFLVLLGFVLQGIGTVGAIN